MIVWFDRHYVSKRPQLCFWILNSSSSVKISQVLTYTESSANYHEVCKFSIFLKTDTTLHCKTQLCQLWLFKDWTTKCCLCFTRQKSIVTSFINIQIGWYLTDIFKHKVVIVFWDTVYHCWLLICGIRRSWRSWRRWLTGTQPTRTASSGKMRWDRRFVTFNKFTMIN